MSPILIIVIAIAVVLVIVLISIYNGLVQKRLRIDEAFAQIDVQLKRRHDLIPNLVDAVKDYMGFEQKMLTDVTKARAAAIDAGDQGPTQQAAAENALTGTLKIPVRGGRELPGAEGQPERDAAPGGADLDGEQDRLRAAASTTTACSTTTTKIADLPAGPHRRDVQLHQARQFFEVDLRPTSRPDRRPEPELNDRRGT